MMARRQMRNRSFYRGASRRPRLASLAWMLALFLSAVPALRADTLISTGAVWKYLDNGSNQGTAWRGIDFDDSAWTNGPAQLGFGDGDEAHVINGGPSTNRYITTY